MTDLGERPIPSAELTAWLLGGVEPERAAEIADRVACSPQLQERVRALEREHLDPVPAHPSPVPLPPEGFRRAGWPRLEVAPAPRLSHALRPGDRFTLHLDRLPDAQTHQLVVLVHEARRWRIIFPEGPEDRLPIDALPQDPRGRRILELSARPWAGRQRWALAFPHLDFPFAWGAAEPWGPLFEALRRGALKVGRFSITVEA
ncbi:MAG: hypothetical protein H6739_15185 [Alphaproteobacteria bacterium]|nr:hypothetical protein [Alphaproteobacteria bacterium]